MDRYVGYGLIFFAFLVAGFFAGGMFAERTTSEEWADWFIAGADQNSVKNDLRDARIRAAIKKAKETP